VKVQNWNGTKWVPVSQNWLMGDKALVRKLVEESSAKYAAEKKITPGCLN
jgi:branched-chain amino acid transport system substrate-binding protein